MRRIDWQDRDPTTTQRQIDRIDYLIAEHGTLHHVELSVPAIGRAIAEWGWLLIVMVGDRSNAFSGEGPAPARDLVIDTRDLRQA